MAKGFEVLDAGVLEFPEAVRLQQELVNKVRGGLLRGALVVCSHNPVITLGSSARKENILVPEQELARRNIRVYPCRRGGDVTYHGPGQLVLYPVINLRHFRKDLHWFLRSLETWAIEVLAEVRITASTRAGATGVWVREKKIASIGIGVRDWVTFNGMALNVEACVQADFSLIRACGLDCSMTSIEQESGNTDLAVLAETFIRRCPYA